MERMREVVVGTAGDGRLVAFGSGRWDNIARSPVLEKKNFEKEAFNMRHESLISCLSHLGFFILNAFTQLYSRLHHRVTFSLDSVHALNLLEIGSYRLNQPC
jgi:hypothetical protein